MSEALTWSVSENKLNELNKKIVEIKKKIQLSEGQRKANFEEYDAKKRENGQRISDLKKKVKELYTEYAKAKNNEEAMERAILLSGDSIIVAMKHNLEEVIDTANENNVRLRKKLDLIKYRREKYEKDVNILQVESKELTRKRGNCVYERKTENPIKKKIEKLEVEMEHIRMMRIKANIARMKYRSICAELKEKSTFYASSLKDLEDRIRQQENEMKRLQEVKKEAIELRDSTQETLAKEGAEESTYSQKRDCIIKEYRRRVSERKMELERLERMIFHTRPSRNDFETRGKGRVQMEEDNIKDELTRLEDVFAKLRCVTGVSRFEQVLNRFLDQRTTKDSLQRMRATTEEEKIALEKKRHDLSAEIERRKFSETKSAERNAEMEAKLNRQIDERRYRREKSETKSRRVRELSNDIAAALRKLYEKFQDIKMESPLEIIELLNHKVKYEMDILNVSDKHLETIDQTLTDKLETMSIATTSAGGKTIRVNDGPLFLQFPFGVNPAVALSEDEEEVPTRNVLKKQAQLLIDTKSRRKGFSFKR